MVLQEPICSGEDLIPLHEVVLSAGKLMVCVWTHSVHVKTPLVHNKYTQICTSNIVKSKFLRTSLKMNHDISSMFEIFTAQTAAKFSVV